MRTPGGITVESLFGATTRQPLVKLTIHDADPTQEPIIEVLMPPSKARQIAFWLLESAEAATSDAFIAGWCAQLRDDADPAELAQMTALAVRDFRQFRELQRRAGVEREEADEQEWRDAHP